MKCHKCGAEIPEGKNSCPNCGTPIIRIRPKSICSNCGTEIPEDAEKCPGCHRKVIRRRLSPEEAQKINAERGINNKNVNFQGMAGRAEFMKGADIYAWAQAVLPTVFSLLYHFMRTNESTGENLLNTLMCFAGFTILFGFMDVAEVNRRLRKRKMALGDDLRLQMTFLPIMGLWKRRMIPGMDRNAWYPHVHSALLLIFVFVISFGGGLNSLIFMS